MEISECMKVHFSMKVPREIWSQFYTIFQHLPKSVRDLHLSAEWINTEYFIILDGNQ